MKLDYNEKCVWLISAWLKSADGFGSVLRLGGWAFFTCLSSRMFSEKTILQLGHRISFFMLNHVLCQD